MRVAYQWCVPHGVLLAAHSHRAWWGWGEWGDCDLNIMSSCVVLTMFTSLCSILSVCMYGAGRTAFGGARQVSAPLVCLPCLATRCYGYSVVARRVWGGGVGGVTQML